MIGSCKMKGTGPKTGPRLFPSRARSELQHVSRAENPRVEADLSHWGAAHRRVGVDVDPAHIGAQRALLAEGVVDAGMNRHAPGIIEADRRARERAGAALVPEMGVVHADADERRQVGAVGEVILHRDRGRQVLGFADIARASKLEIMFERPGGQNLDTDVVGHEIFEGQGRARVVADPERAGRGGAVAAVGHDRMNTKAEGHVALGLGKRGGSKGREGGGKRKCSYRFHESFRLIVVVGAVLRCGEEKLFDSGQLNVNMLQCGKNTPPFREHRPLVERSKGGR